MKNHAGESATADDLITALESASSGSRPLDVQLAYLLGEARDSSAASGAGARLPAKWHALGDFPAIAKIMLDEGFSWQSVCDVLDCEAPAYTTSLDAGIPGENIVFVIRSAKRNQWGAIHKTSDGEEIFGWGATEALARRVAALKSWARTAGQENSASGANQESRGPGISEMDPPADGSESQKPTVTQAGSRGPRRESLEKSLEEQEEHDWEILF